VTGERVGWGAVLARTRAAVILTLLALGGAALLRHDASDALPFYRLSGGDFRNRAGRFGNLPLSFEPNQGQSDSRVQFQARGNGYALYLTRDGGVLQLPVKQSKTALIRMHLSGANPFPRIAGEQLLPGRSNYFVGNDASRWRTHVPQFARVRYSEIYHGVDLTFYGNQGRLEYDFEVHPGAAPLEIALHFDGAEAPTLTGNGDLVLNAGGRQLRFEAPRSYQRIDGKLQAVASKFVVRGNSVGFETGNYDPRRTLIIDPVLTYSTFLGGTGSESCAAAAGAAFVAHCPAIAVDSASRTYVAGTTSSATLGGVTPGIIGVAGATDVFVARLNSTGTALDYVTYIAGSGSQYPAGVGVDSGFNVYVGGTTTSNNFPTTATAFQANASSAPTHVFFSKLDSTGSANLYTTYLSGTGAGGDSLSDLAVDALGRAYLMGITNSSDFPVTGGALQPTAAATSQFFFSKIDPTTGGTNSLQYSTFIGGGTPSSGTVSGGAVAVDSGFNVYLAGGTTFADMPVVNAYQSALKAGTDAWAARLNAPANNTQQYTPSYETYLGGSGNDVAYGVGTDGSSSYVTGSTTSNDFTLPTATTAFQNANKGGTDAFVARFGVPTTTGTTTGSVPLTYFTYLGGSATDVGLSIVADSTQNARVTGFTNSSDFPAPNNPIQGSFGGGASDAFLARIATTSTSTSTNPSSATFLGGAGTDIGTAIASDPGLNSYVAGETSSGNFPTANALQPNLAGGVDAFVSKLGPNTSGLTMPQITPANTASTPGPNVSNPVVSPTPVGVGSQVTYTYYIFNTGDPVSGVIFTDTLGASSGTATASASIGSSSSTCSSATGGSIVCNLGTVNTSSTTTSGSTTTLSSAGKVTVTVTAPTNALAGPFSLGNSAVLSFPGGSTASVSGTATVNDFSISASPASATVTSGAPATYTVKVTPTGSGFPESVSLSCGSGLPSGAACSFPSNGNPIPSMSNGPQSRALEITTTARVTTPGALFPERKIFYAFWLPISGLAVIGTGVTRRRRWLMGAFFAVLIGVVGLQAGCGSSSKNTTTTTGTPAGTYTITVNGTTGSTATRTTTVQLTVQ
jgi:hypothetical protein